VGRLGLSADVRADETLQPFDCVIDSVNGQHVVSLDTQLAAIARALGVSETVDIEVS
jgi:flagellar biosynthesis/type III secretory pathway protein FliH